MTPAPPPRPTLPSAEQAGGADALRGGLVSGLIATLALLGLATLAGLALAERGDVAPIALLYLGPVMFAAIRLGLRPGLGAGLLSSLVYTYFFIPPRFTLLVADPAQLITLVVLLGVALGGSHMAKRLHEQARLAEARAGRDALLAGFAGSLMAVTRAEALWAFLASEIARVFDVRVLVLAPDEGGALALVAAEPAQERADLLEMAAAQWCFDGGRATGPGGQVPTASEWLFVPVPGRGGPLAVVGVGHPEAAMPLHGPQLPLLESLLAQTGLALSRMVLEEQAHALDRVQERERLRSALLSSIGHDLRTPLTTVLGTLRALQPLSADQATALSSARAEAERLDRFVANLIDMVRIETGAIERAAEAVDLAEACDAALDHFAPGLLRGRVALAVADDLPLVMADPRLLHHCLINLIDNADRHGGPDGTIAIEGLALADGGVELAVCDQGPGVPAGERERIFGLFARIEGTDRTGGTGLGLAIVKGFADAMGVVVEAGERQGGGARFVLRFPAGLVRAVPLRGVSA
jgi:two-component system, OmpR family, sensor histidine kinase KdpD